MTDSLIPRILNAYGITYQVIRPPQKGYRNQSFCVEAKNNLLNVLLYKTEAGMSERIIRANKLGDFLAARGLPARRTFSPRILCLKNARGIKYAAIYYYLPGNTIPWEAYTMRRLKELGQTMATMHSAVRDYSGMLPSLIGELTALHARMQQYFVNQSVSTALQQKLDIQVSVFNFTEVFTHASRLPAQPLHMDFVRGNILFTGNTISGILDFEKAAQGPPIFDIARTLAFLLVDCKHKPAAKIRKYFLQSGYVKRGDQQLPSPNLLETLVSFFLLHDFYKFLRHNPYEYLPRNEHFMRTRSILLQRGLIRVK